MKYYKIVTESDKNAIKVNNNYIALYECDDTNCEDVISQCEKLELQYDDHWHCNARTDNGIDDDKIECTHIEKINPEQAVFDNDNLVGVYFSNENTLLYINDKIKINIVDKGYAEGWGDVYTYTIASLKIAE